MGLILGSLDLVLAVEMGLQHFGVCGVVGGLRWTKKVVPAGVLKDFGL